MVAQLYGGADEPQRSSPRNELDSDRRVHWVATASQPCRQPAAKAFESRRPSRLPPRSNTAPDHAADDDDDDDDLVCIECLAAVTSDAFRIDVGGNHAHTFMNPHGYAFHIGCFAAAPGARPYDRKSSEWPWFPGHTWQMTACAQCSVHLGWLFDSQQRRFFGLILARLTRRAQCGPTDQ